MCCLRSHSETQKGVGRRGRSVGVVVVVSGKRICGEGPQCHPDHVHLAWISRGRTPPIFPFAAASGARCRLSGSLRHRRVQSARMALPTRGRVIIDTTAGEIDIELWSKVSYSLSSEMTVLTRRRKRRRHVATSYNLPWKVFAFACACSTSSLSQCYRLLRRRHLS